MQDNLPILRCRSVTLITMAKSPLPFNITYSQAPGIRVWTSLEVHSIFHVCLVPVYESVFRPNLIDLSQQEISCNTLTNEHGNNLPHLFPEVTMAIYSGNCTGERVMLVHLEDYWTYQSWPSCLSVYIWDQVINGVLANIRPQGIHWAYRHRWWLFYHSLNV